jgi:hypothetical protein
MSAKNEMSETKKAERSRRAAHSNGARKPELRTTAWWSWQDSNRQPNDYGRWMTGCMERVVSVREPQHLLLARPCDWCIEKTRDTDSAR